MNRLAYITLLVTVALAASAEMDPADSADAIVPEANAIAPEDAALKLNDALLQEAAEGRRRKGFSISKAAKKAAKKAKEIAKKANLIKTFKKTLDSAKKGAKAAKNIVKNIGKASGKYTAITKNIAKKLWGIKSQVTSVATEAVSKISFGCSKSVNLNFPNPAKFGFTPGKSDFGKFGKKKFKLCSKPTFLFNGQPASKSVTAFLAQKLKGIAATLAGGIGGTAAKHAAQFAKANFRAKDGMFSGPPCGGSTWTIGTTVSFGAGVGASGVGGDVGFEVGVEIGCMSGLPSNLGGGKRLVIVPFWGFGAGVSAGATGNGAGIDFNVGFGFPYSYYKAGGLPGGLSIGGSVSAGDYGMSASVGFGIPPYWLVVNEKKFSLPTTVKVAGITFPKSVTLPVPKSPYVATSFGGVGLTFPLVGIEVPSMELVQPRVKDEEEVEEIHVSEELMQAQGAELTIDAGWSMACRRWDASITQCFDPMALVKALTCAWNCGR